MKGVLEVLGKVLRSKKRFVVALVFGEEPGFHVTFRDGVEFEIPKMLVPDFEVITCEFNDRVFQAGIFAGALPPNVTKPNGGEHVQGSGVRPVVGRGDTPEEIVVVAFGHLLYDIEEAVFFEDPGVFEFEFTLVATPCFIFFPEPGVGKPLLRVTVKGLGVGVSRGAVLIVVALLDVFSVVSLVSGETVETFLQDGILAVPECE